MRYVYIALVTLITLTVATFKIQNLEQVTLNFLSSRVTMPVSVLVFLVYFLGMITGGLVISVIRNIWQKAMPPVTTYNESGRR